MDRIYRWLVWHLPRRLIYFAALRLGAEVTTTSKYVKTIVPDLPLMTALKRWEETL